MFKEFLFLPRISGDYACGERRWGKNLSVGNMKNYFTRKHHVIQSLVINFLFDMRQNKNAVIAG